MKKKEIIVCVKLGEKNTYPLGTASNIIQFGKTQTSMH